MPALLNLGLGQHVPESHSGAACGQLNAAQTNVTAAPVQPGQRVFTVKCKAENRREQQHKGAPGSPPQPCMLQEVRDFSMLLMGPNVIFIQIPS